MKATFEVEGEALGEADLEPHLGAGKWHEPRSHAFVCPVCARVWARIVVEGKEFLIWRTNCPQHLTPFFSCPAGTLWLPLEVEVLEKMPRKVLEREFHLHLENAQRFGRI